MNLATLDMPRAEARKAFLEYRHAVKERHNAEDEQIMKGYRALSRGTPILQLHDAIVRGGFNRDGLPMLGVIRADAQYCHLRLEREGRIMMTNDGDFWRNRHAGRFDWPEGTAPGWQGGEWRQDFRALTPSIPPALRPKGNLGRFHILFEAEWHKVSPPAPRDPALLKHLGGDLYAVVAVWDLTELERAVLAGRRLT